jgi:hypothetical protein
VTARPSLALLALAVGLAACGEAKQDRFDLRTPGAHTGLGPVSTPPPAGTATAPPKGKSRGKAGAKKPKSEPAPTRVTAEERRIIRGWSDALRHGHVAAASRYFGVPALVVNPDQAILNSREAVQSWTNFALPCGAKLLTTRRGEAGTVIATFRLTERPGGSCTGTGQLAAAEILVKKHHIIQWLRRDDAIDPAATATPAPGRSGGGG